jgi:hypothetical protein
VTPIVFITSAVFTRSVQIASTAWAFSAAVCGEAAGVPRHAVSGTFLHDKCGDGHNVSGEPYRA